MSISTETNSDDWLDEPLHGAKAIGECRFVKLNEDQTAYLLRKGLLDADRRGRHPSGGLRQPQLGQRRSRDSDFGMDDPALQLRLDLDGIRPLIAAEQVERGLTATFVLPGF